MENTDANFMEEPEKPSSSAELPGAGPLLSAGLTPSARLPSARLPGHAGQPSIEDEDDDPDEELCMDHAMTVILGLPPGLMTLLEFFASQRVPDTHPSPPAYKPDPTPYFRSPTLE
ncbi:hypothetical protein RIE95_09705 [Acidithiobacillus thiooxidans]|nr:MULTISPECIES: hypothetical protein [Acidithiobacillus]MBU2740688.1 hypothetical protein [Acidithiobacillus albertensis]MBU2812362.1 hypothetical protein [Acidithiobacillus thiooxidans]MBU2836689.1 hypothetical protein [Acidithiobacillus thiooxidans]MDR7927253.1 hypothetical protein [Acidithiobacillus thiooxidans]